MMKLNISLHLAVLLLFTSPATASVCRNLTNASYSTESNRQFSTVDEYRLVNIICPANNTANAPGCPIPRPRTILYPTIERYINASVTPEDEDAIFELARVGYWSRNLANNQSLWDKAWDDKQATVNLNDRRWSESLLTAKPGMNYTLYFVAFTRNVVGTLGGCDNETLNGMGVVLRAPFLENNTVLENQTEVAGTLIGSGRNITGGSGGNNTNDAGRSALDGAGLLATGAFAMAFAILL